MSSRTALVLVLCGVALLSGCIYRRDFTQAELERLEMSVREMSKESRKLEATYHYIGHAIVSALDRLSDDGFTCRILTVDHVHDGKLTEVPIVRCVRKQATDDSNCTDALAIFEVAWSDPQGDAKSLWAQAPRGEITSEAYYCRDVKGPGQKK